MYNISYTSDLTSNLFVLCTNMKVYIFIVGGFMKERVK